MGLINPIFIHIGFLFFTLDMFTDCNLMYYYYTTNQMIYFWLTLFFTAGPWIFNNIYLLWDKDLGCNKYLAGLMALCQVLVIYCIIRNLILIWRGKTEMLNSSNVTLRIIENFGESMPQLCIQSYSIFKTLAKNDFAMEFFVMDDLWNALESGAEDVPNIQLLSVAMSLISVTGGFVVFAFENATILYQFVLFIFSLICAGLRVSMVVAVATYDPAKYTWWIPPLLGFFASFFVWLVRRYCLCVPSFCETIEPEVKYEMNHRYTAPLTVPPTREYIPNNPEPVQQKSLGALNILVWFTNLAFNWYNFTGLLINCSFLGCYAIFTWWLSYDEDSYRRSYIALLTFFFMTVANIFMMFFYYFCSCLKWCCRGRAFCFKSCCFCKGCYAEETDWLY